MLVYLMLLISVMLGGCADTDALAPLLENAPPTPLSLVHSPQALNKIAKAVAVTKCDSAAPVRVEPIRNEHDPKIMDEIQVASCDGLEISTYFAKYFSPPKEFPMQMILRTKDRRFPREASIGARAEEVIRTLGTPLRRDETAIVYQADIEGLASDTITFKLAKGVVEQVEWDWYFP